MVDAIEHFIKNLEKLFTNQGNLDLLNLVSLNQEQQII